MGGLTETENLAVALSISERAAQNVSQRERQELAAQMDTVAAKLSALGLDPVLNIAEQSVNPQLSEALRLKASMWLAEQVHGKAAQAITGADGADLIPAMVQVNFVST